MNTRPERSQAEAAQDLPEAGEGGVSASGHWAILYILARHGPQRWKDIVRISKNEFGEFSIKHHFGPLRHTYGFIRYSLIERHRTYEITEKGWDNLRDVLPRRRPGGQNRSRGRS